MIGGLGELGELGALGALGELGGSQGAAEPRQGRASRYGGALRGRGAGAHTPCEGGVGSKIWESEGRGYFLPGGGGIAVESAGAKCAYGTSEIVDSAFLQVSILGKGILVP